MGCICISRDSIGPSMTREYATWFVADWQKGCPVHQDCEHAFDQGMCWRCAPAGHLPTPAEMNSHELWFAAYRASQEAKPRHRYMKRTA